METKTHVCPVWVGYIMASPLRKLQQNPKKLLHPYIRKGYKVLEIGPAMGFFSLPMAQMVQDDGKVYCADIQVNMLQKLRKRAEKQQLEKRIELIVADQQSLNLDKLAGHIDFCLLAFVAHEVPNQQQMFLEIAHTLKQGAKILFMEPKGHVKEDAWEQSLLIAKNSGFSIKNRRMSKGSRICELIKI